MYQASVLSNSSLTLKRGIISSSSPEAKDDFIMPKMGVIVYGENSFSFYTVIGQKSVI